MDPLPQDKQLPSTVRRVSLKKPFIIGVVAVLIYSLVGFFLAPYLIKRQLEGYVSRELSRKISIAKVRSNPYALTIELVDVALSEADGQPLFSFERLFANFDLISLFRRAWTFGEIRLDQPALALKIESDGIMNLTRLAQDAAAEKEDSNEPPNKAEPEKPPARFYFDRIRLTDGVFTFADLSDATSAEIILKPINIEIDDLNTLPDREGVHKITAVLPQGGKLEWAGAISLNPFESEGSLALHGLKKGLIWMFLQDELNLTRPAGSTDVGMDYFISNRNDTFQFVLDKVRMLVSGLQLALKGEPDTSHILSLGEIQLSDGRLDLVSKTYNLGHVAISNGDVMVKVDSNGQLNWQGIAVADQSQPQGAKVDEKLGKGRFDLQFEQIDVSQVALKVVDESRFTPMDLEIGELNLSLFARVAKTPEATQTLLDDIVMAMGDISLHLADENETLVFLPQAKILAGPVDFTNRTAIVGEMELTGGQVALWLEKDGVFNFSRLKSRSDISAHKVDASKSLDSANDTPPWSFELLRATLNTFGLHFSDRGFSSPTVYQLENIQLGLTNFKNDPDQSFNFDFSFDVKQGGKASAMGEVNPFKPDIEAKLELTAVALPPLQPYFDTMAKLSLDSGGFSYRGDVRYGQGEGNGLALNGDALLDNLRMTLPLTKETLLSWKRLDTRGLQFTTTPGGLAIGEVLLFEPKGKLVIQKDKSVNVSDVIKEDNKNRQKSSDDQPFPVDIKHVRVKKGELDFADHSLLFPFRVKIHDLKGTLAGLSSHPESRASIDLKGRAQEYGSVDIKGRLQPFDLRTFLDVSMIFQNLEMTELTPYSAEFAGRKISSGKLFLDLNYNIDNSKLKGENDIRLDSFVLGDRVEGTKAANLPLDLAVALLKDADDRIDIGLPISGDLEDPKFSYGHLIWKAFVNLVTKIVAAPFRALGALLGSEKEQLDTVAFEAGQSELPPAEMEKLARLAKALQKRPQLILEIQGRYDPESDGFGLKERIVKSEVARRLGLPLETDKDPDPFNLTDLGVQKVLKALAAERLTSEKRDEIKAAATLSGGAKKSKIKVKNEKIPAPEQTALDPVIFYNSLYKALVTTETLDKTVFTVLSTKRSEAIANELTQTNGLPKERTIVLDPTTSDDVQKSRVTSKLKLSVKK